MTRSAGAVTLVAALLWGGWPGVRPGFAQAPAQAAPEPQTEAIWTCPVHAVVAEKSAGRCPICRRDLIPVTATVTWTCADRPEIDRPVQGNCLDGSPMEPRYTQSTHANHNPRHGGLFFMAPDSWHHLEGAYSEDGMFRVYLYDDFTKPLAPELARDVRGRVVLKETFDAATRTTRELAASPLTLSTGGEYLEAKVGKIRFPAEMTAKVTFARGAQEYRFDFTFPEYSTGAATAPAAATGPLFEVPDAGPDVLLRLLGERTRLIGDLVRKGAFGEVWVPAFQAKDLALALDVRTRTLPQAVRVKATLAVEQLVRAAWLIDAAGDTGNRGDVEEAYGALSRAASDVLTIYRAAR